MCRRTERPQPGDDVRRLVDACHRTAAPARFDAARTPGLDSFEEPTHREQRVGRQPDAVLRHGASRGAHRSRCRGARPGRGRRRSRRRAVTDWRSRRDVSVAAVCRPGHDADEVQPESVRRDVPQDHWRQRTSRALRRQAARRGACGPPELECRHGRSHSGRWLRAVALQLRDAGNARGDTQPCRSRRAPARTIRGDAADRRPGQHARRADEGYGGRGQRADQGRGHGQRARDGGVRADRRRREAGRWRLSRTISTARRARSPPPPTPSSSGWRRFDVEVGAGYTIRARAAARMSSELPSRPPACARSGFPPPRPPNFAVSAPTTWDADTEPSFDRAATTSTGRVAPTSTTT